MFYHAYDNYMTHAFPKDELKPLSCEGFDTWVSSQLTLVDTLDTLVIIGNNTEFIKGVKYVVEHANFEKDIPVSVFETNIRIVGGLISAHLLASDKKIMSDYKGELLPILKDLVDRLSHAFKTTTGIPYGTVNFKNGVPPNEVKVTSVAGAGTFLLEFGLLSHLLGNSSYLEMAEKATIAIFERRSALGLVGNHINIETGHWTLKESGIGSSIDSFFEYLFKGYLLFGTESYHEMFVECYKSIKKHLYKNHWYYDVDMNTANTVWPIFNSLQAFFPGIEALAGNIPDARKTVANFHSVWRRFGMTPEGFNIQHGAVQNGQQGYPLRPELAESIYTLYRITKDPIYLFMGRDIVYSINKLTRVKCGFAVVKDVQTGVHEDKMESFFLAETLKYLYLLFDEENFVNQNPYTFNTEGHIIPLKKEFLSKNFQEGIETKLLFDNAQCGLIQEENFHHIV
eukprot:gene2502-3208_t